MNQARIGVREVAYGADGLASCELARPEFASILRRHVRERHVTRREMTAILKEFEEDEQNGVWQWLGVTSELLETARKAVLDLPSTVSVRPGDALHLACAEEQGFQEVYTNDRHMLQAAKHFHVTAVNVLSESRLTRSTAPKSVDGWWTDRRIRPDLGRSVLDPRSAGYPSRRASVGSTRTARRAGPAAESRPMVRMKMAAAGRIPGMCHPPSTSMLSLR